MNIYGISVFALLLFKAPFNNRLPTICKDYGKVFMVNQDIFLDERTERNTEEMINHLCSIHNTTHNNIYTAM